MNNEAVSKRAKANYINPQALRTQVFIVHVMDVIAFFSAYLYPREESTAVMRILEKIFML
jgi:hypothetical protein